MAMNINRYSFGLFLMNMICLFTVCYTQNITTNRPLLVVAIDFGTSFSGYSFSRKEDFETDPTKPFISRIETSPAFMKTTTALLLNPSKKFHAFGYKAEQEYKQFAARKEHESWYYFHEFKTKLYGEKKFSEDLIIEDETGKPFPAIEVFSMSIAYLKQNFILRLAEEDIEIDESKINWVLTVPSIWNDFAKKFMRKAATDAGIISEQLQIAIEPEAAALYEIMAIEGSETAPGTKYMVMDLGGGIVDVVFHTQLQQGKLKEITKAGGGPWGGIAIDKAYIQLLTNIVGEETMHRFRKEEMYEYLYMIEDFKKKKTTIYPTYEEQVKFKLSKKLNDICQEVNGVDIDTVIESPNSTLRGKVEIKGEYLLVNFEIVEQMFNNLTSKIIDHIDGIVNSVHDLSFIFLVGGFSSSSFVIEAIKSKYETEERLVIVSGDPELAIVKGAVTFGHDTSVIQSRILRYTYGEAISYPFEQTIHSEDKKYTLNGEDKVDVFVPIIKSETRTEIGYTVTRKYSYTEANFSSALISLYVSTNPNTMYPDDEGSIGLRVYNIASLLPLIPEQVRNVSVDCVFGDTEIEFIFKEEATDFKLIDKF